VTAKQSPYYPACQSPNITIVQEQHTVVCCCEACKTEFTMVTKDDRQSFGEVFTAKDG